MYHKRIRLFLLLVMVSMVVLVGRLAQLQLTRADVYDRERQSNLQRRPTLIETGRGRILDRNGLALAEDTPRFDLCVYYPMLVVEDEAFLRRVATATGEPLDALQREFEGYWLDLDSRFLSRETSRFEMTVEGFRRKLSEFWPRLAREVGYDLSLLDERRLEAIRKVNAWKRNLRRINGYEIIIPEETYYASSSIPHVMIEDIDERTKAYTAGIKVSMPYVQVTGGRKRAYPYGDCAAHVVGYASEVPEELVGELPKGESAGDGERPDRLRIYRLGDQVGVTGIEASCEAELRGRRGLRQLNASGQVLRYEPPRAGRDIRLTLDAVFQSEVEGWMSRPPDLPSGHGRVRGAAVVIDTRTGGILALASTPRFDPNRIRAEMPDLIVDGSGHPLLHRAIAAQLSLGSIFKGVSATAGLHEGAVTPEETLYCGGRLYTDPGHPLHNRFKCWNQYGHGSVNLHGATRESCNVYFYQLGQRLGSDTLVEWGRKFGFGTEVGIDLPGEADGGLPAGNDPRNLAIGQGSLTVTPLQVARVAALLATSGRMPEVHLVASPRQVPVGTVDLGLNPRYADIVRRAWSAVVNEQGGTGHRTVYTPRVRIAGKTGSAQSTPGRPTHSWFVGFAPADDPQIAFAVVFEHAGGGSSVAGPVGRRICETALDQGIINNN